MGDDKRDGAPASKAHGRAEPSRAERLERALHAFSLQLASFLLSRRSVRFEKLLWQMMKSSDEDSMI